MPRIAMLEGFQGAGFGAALSQQDAAIFEKLAKDVISDLRRALLFTQLKIKVYPLATAETKRGLLQTVSSYQAQINVREKGISAVILGETAPKKWLTSCGTVKAGIEDLARMLHEENAVRFLQERWVAVAAKLEQLGKNLDAGLDTTITLSKYLVPGLLVGGGLLVLWHLNGAMKSARRATGLQGYRRRRG